MEEFITSRMKKTRLASKVITFLFIILIIVYLIKNKKDLSTLLEIKLSSSMVFILLTLSVLVFLFIVNNGLLIKFLLLPYNIKLGLMELIGLSVMTTLGNYITPFRGGAALRAYYLKRKYNFTYTDFLGNLSGIYVITFLVNSLIGIISILLLYSLENKFNLLIFIVFLIIFLGLLLVIAVPFRLGESNLRFLKVIIGVLNSWSKIRTNNYVIFTSMFISLINLIIIALITYFEFRFFGIRISLIESLFIGVFNTISLLISITPGALGIKETFMIFSANVVGINPTVTLVVSILDRVFIFFISLFLSPLIWFRAIKRD